MEYKNDYEVYDSKSLARILGLSQASVRKLAFDGKIKAFRDGKKMFYDVASVKRYIGRVDA